MLVAGASAALLAKFFTVLSGRFAQKFYANRLRFAYALRNCAGGIQKCKIRMRKNRQEKTAPKIYG
jgi:hypothetical protein